MFTLIDSPTVVHTFFCNNYSKVVSMFSCDVCIYRKTYTFRDLLYKRNPLSECNQSATIDRND